MIRVTVEYQRGDENIRIQSQATREGTSRAEALRVLEATAAAAVKQTIAAVNGR